jgi:hypothetical protein
MEENCIGSQSPQWTVELEKKKKKKKKPMIMPQYVLITIAENKNNNNNNELKCTEMLLVQQFTIFSYQTIT